MKKAEGGSKGIQRWLKRQQRRLSGKMLGIGDGANDVAMIQARFSSWPQGCEGYG